LAFALRVSRGAGRAVVNNKTTVNRKTAIMKNPIPRSLSGLFTLCGKAADALHTHESEIGIMHNTESLVRSGLANARSANSKFQSAKAARLTAFAAQELADINATKLITVARDILKRHLGGRYSQAWDEAGFTNQSLAVPGQLSQRTELLKSLETYFTNHPSHEVAALEVTHTQAAALHAALTTAVSAANAAKGDQRGFRDERASAEETLRARVRGLVSELAQLIGEDDQRWIDFGLHVPEDESLPDAPTDLVVAGGAQGHLVAGWSDAARAERYRVYKQVVGVDNDFTLSATVGDSDADMNTFTSGAHVRVKVTALNARGESQPSEVVEHQVP
jgi:hypothetical protein